MTATDEMEAAAEKYASERYDAQGPIEHQMPWSDCREAYIAGYRAGLESEVVRGMREALRLIRHTSHWYAEVHRGPELEVHHALKVEIYDMADKALAAYDEAKGRV